MGILLFIVFGLIVGFVARAVMPGEQKMGLVMTAVLGIAGSFLGGFVASIISDQRAADFNTAGVIGSVIGAIILLAIGSYFGGSSRRLV
ncbi:MAG: GlsB/YeaQ/YmgE family stress response membrane protein [Polyangiaceae bacterium]|nr:GlsB/YeaQ/YmgE family stress response membrane protein [Polyangiaceae bacterium]